MGVLFTSFGVVLVLFGLVAVLLGTPLWIPEVEEQERVEPREPDEERANGTIELLLTSPLTIWEIVLGKYLAVLAVLSATR